LTNKSLLQNSRVHVWSVELAQPPARVPELEALLSEDERERAAGLADGARWVVARAALRTVLARELAVAPGELRFALGPHGKPELPGAELRFNLSHSGDRAVIAVAGVEVGIDVERTARRSRAIERTLTAGERDAIGDADRHVELLRIWCRKEALAKAIGGGLGWAPETFDTTQPDGHVLADLDPGEGFVGAVALAAAKLELELRRLDL
jgi:4'-phosphopantetheinyl transferase